MNLNTAQIYIVEIEKEDNGWSSGIAPIYVVTNSYDDAAKKAMEYADDKYNSSTSVIESDGSLKAPVTTLLKIRSVKQACDKIIY